MAAAERDLAKAFNGAKEDEEIALAYATLLRQKGDPNAAKGLFLETMATNKRSFSARSGLGMVELQLGEFTAAEQHFLEALAINDRFRPARIGLAAAKLMQGHYDEAAQECDRILAPDPNCPEAYELLGFSKLLKGDPASLEDGKVSLDQSLKGKADQPRVTLAYAALLERLARFDQLKSDPGMATRFAAAREKFDQVLVSKTDDSVIQYFIGERRFRDAETARVKKELEVAKINYLKAEDAFQHVVRLAPNYAPAHGALGAVQLQLEKWEEARQSFALAAKLDPTSGDYYSGQGLALLKTGAGLDKAKDLLMRARECDARQRAPRNVAAALCGLGYIENSASNKDGAIEFFQQALAADGGCVYAVNALQAIYKQEGMTLEYVPFDNLVQMPPGWNFRGTGVLTATVLGNRVRISGIQGLTMSNMVEFFKDVPKADDFVGFEADLEIDPKSGTWFGLRISTGGALTTFALEVGKEDGNRIKVRYKDANVQSPTWTPVADCEWPENRRLRLAVHTQDLGSGLFDLWINGKKVATQLPLSLARTERTRKLTVGTFLLAPPKEVVEAYVDNLVLITRSVPAKEETETGGIKFIENAPGNRAPANPPAPDKKSDDN
jgi:tetratricopeptide (TPR) repeat protein